MVNYYIFLSNYVSLLSSPLIFKFSITLAAASASSLPSVESFPLINFFISSCPFSNSFLNSWAISAFAKRIAKVYISSSIRAISEETERTYCFDQFIFSKVISYPNPRLIVSNVWLQHNSWVQEMVNNDFHGLFLTHQHPDSTMILVFQKFNLSNASFFPGLVACTFVKQCFTIQKQFGTSKEEIVNQSKRFRKRNLLLV